MTSTLAHLRAKLQSQETTSRELTREALDRMAQGAGLNAFISVDREGALAAADVADARRAAGDDGALLGIPYAHKDIFCTTRLPTTCGSRMLENFTAPYDAFVHQRLQDAGGVMVGKTNMDEFAMGSSTENSAFGPSLNPWDHGRVPGGSSGGSAVAVAAGMVPLATGTDTGGSVRQPAALCGITGIKPTYGRVSRYGMIAFASSLDQAGVFARSAEDCALTLGTIAGFDPRDSTCIDRPVDDYVAGLSEGLDGLRIGIAKEFFGRGVDDEVAATIQGALKELEKAGAELVDITLPRTGLGVAAYYLIAPSEASSNLARYDGVRYGYRCEQPSDLEDLYERTRSEGFGAEVKRRILLGTYALSTGYYDAYYLKAQKVRRLIADDFAQAFSAVDVIAGPTAPTPAFALGANVDDPVAMYQSDVNTVTSSLAGLPAISLPAGLVSGLPVGLQLIGPAFAEARLLNVGHQFQQLTDWHEAAPP